MVEKHKVLIMRCDSYDAEKIAEIIKEGMEELNAIPSGNILLKPNVVMAHKEFFPHAFTRPEFVDGVLAATKEMAKNVKEISVGERSGITIPTRYNFKQAGYPEVIKKHGVKTYYFDEVKHLPFKFEKDVNLRKNMFFPKPIVDCDFLINLPMMLLYFWLLSNKVKFYNAFAIIALPAVMLSLQLFYSFERPQGFSFNLVMIIALVMERVRHKAKDPTTKFDFSYVLLPVVTALWSNIHAGYIVGNIINGE